MFSIEKIKNPIQKNAYRAEIKEIENTYQKLKEEEKDKNNKDDKPTNTTPDKDNTTPSKFYHAAN